MAENEDEEVSLSSCSTRSSMPSLMWGENLNYIDTTVNVPEEMHQNHPNVDLTNYPQLSRMKNAMQEYTESPDATNIDISVVVNDFLDLFSIIEDGSMFESMFNYLCVQDCSVNECAVFRRNYVEKQITSTRNNSAILDIMDKIHCFWHHSFDIGHFLMSDEIAAISEMKGDEEVKDHNILFQNYSLNLNNLLRDKRQKILMQNIDVSIDRKSKYNQLYPANNKQIVNRNKHDTDIFEVASTFLKPSVQIRRHDKNYYHLGYHFFYGYIGESTGSLADVHVIPKYSSLKEELTTNSISKMTMEQFNNEYTKSSI
eukprot:163063_1